MDVLRFEDLKGKVFQKVENIDDGERLVFTVDDKEKYMLYHIQNCCERVTIEDICGDLNDLAGAPILFAEETTYPQCANPPGINQSGRSRGFDDSFSWTFYRIGTIKGDCTIRWYGSSDGYYSERVDFRRI